MIDAIKEVLLFSENKTLEDLKLDRILSLAVIKDIEILGEAANRISEEFKEEHDEIPWRVIVATRNRLIHGYFDIDLDVVWKTIEQSLPPLLKELRKIVP